MSDTMLDRARGASYTPPAVAAAPKPAGVDWLFLAALLAVAGAIVRAIWFTPIERLQGPAQKIFYIHVPAAFIGMYIACGLVAISSVLFLWLRDERLDAMAESAGELAFVFLSVVLVTGPIWGRPVWGTWWEWEARLTLSLMLWFVLLGYMLLRNAVEDRAMRARFSAVLAVLAALLVPFIHLSVYLFRTMHPMPIVLKPERPSLPEPMLVTFLLSLGAFLLLFAALFRMRYRYALHRDAITALEEEL